MTCLNAAARQLPSGVIRAIRRRGQQKAQPEKYATIRSG